MKNFCDRNYNIKRKEIEAYSEITTRQMDKMGLAVGTII